MLSQRRDPENDPERLVINCTDGVPVGLSQTPEATAVMVRLVEQATEAMLHDPETGALEVLRQFARRLHARPGTFETEERVQLLPGVLYFYLCHPFEELEPELFENLFIAGR